MSISNASEVPGRARRTRPAAHLAYVAVLLWAPIACGSPVETADLRTVTGETEVALFGGLVQRVTITPAEPAIGEEIEIRSVVLNRGGETPTFLENVCRLDLESALELTTTPDWAECKGLPRERGLAPGDSIEVMTHQRVQGVAGEHEIRVLHVVEPQQWVPVRLRLRPLG